MVETLIICHRGENLKQMIHLLTIPGRQVLSFLRQAGQMTLFLLKALVVMPLPPYRPANLLKQIHFIGPHSLFVILLTALFAGMVLGLQGYYTLSRFGSEAMLGPMVALAMIQELGPVLTALMITGRAGSAMAAELGIMRIREQVDALQTMGINPMGHLIVPRLLAGIFVFPLLTAIFNVVGILGGYLVAVQLMGMSSGTYYGEIQAKVDMDDIHMSLIKSLVFGLLVTWVCAFKGYTTGRGAEGVGRATTSAVVLSSVLVLVVDYVITSIMVN
ncbi:MAG: MlaE family lipid ABC transporter permease subunit [Magnetococcus sp. WYHC-3]